MRLYSEIPSRHSIRLQQYDYSQENFYFVTLCVHSRECLFGNISEGNIALNDAGKMVKHWFFELENKYQNLKCDEFICMPNHAHFIVNFRPMAGAGPCVRPYSLGDLVQWFKTMTTNEYVRKVKDNSWKRFSGKLWQRNYWERVIRSETELYFVREYIAGNPGQWEKDALNPLNSGVG